MREARERAEDWDGGRPLSMDQLHYLLKLHAERAGLKAEKITCHTLRATAAMRRGEGGEPPEAVSAVLGRERVDHTKAYLGQLKRRPKGRLMARTRAEGEIRRDASRGPCRARPRNHLALTHGLTAKYLPELEWLAEQGVNLEGLDATILRLRVVVRRAMILGNEVRTLKEGMRLLDALGTAAVRLAKVLKVRHELREAEGEEAAWQAEIEEIRRRLEEAKEREKGW